MSDLTSSRLIIAKGLLFLLSGLLAAGLLLYEHPTLRVGLLLAVAIWCFSRFYYFAFYVVEKYVDGKFRFAGLPSFVVWLCKRRSESEEENETTGEPRT
jgi:hypothetical protein